ncbi:MAG: hypothetical protein J7647_31450 [Cyanobacteria bacterium SBLK]|nr:hypothetical protein [Cyanobacteria bacterium SBLK]
MKTGKNTWKSFFKLLIFLMYCYSPEEIKSDFETRREQLFLKKIPENKIEIELFLFLYNALYSGFYFSTLIEYWWEDLKEIFEYLKQEYLSIVSKFPCLEKGFTLLFSFL